MTRKLAVADIADLRAYERERPEFRDRIIRMKKMRRVAVGPFVTLLFENRDTILFQVQEMARAEKIITDEGIQSELDIYNPLVPEPGSLSATMFIELTSKEDLMNWLPKLVGIEQAVELRIGDAAGSGPLVVGARPDREHEKQLTRDTVTASVHYVHFDLTPDEVRAFEQGPVAVAIAHSNYSFASELPETSRTALIRDLVG
jgi:hypothetical protein